MPVNQKTHFSNTLLGIETRLFCAHRGGHLLRDLASLQPLVVGVIFLWAGAWKVFSPRSGEIAARSGLVLLFRHDNTARRIHRLLGLAELALGLMLLLPPTFWWETRFASGLATVAIFPRRNHGGHVCS